MKSPGRPEMRGAMDSYRAADGAELFFRDAGPRGAATLLFVHGWQADGGVWDAVRAELPRFRTLAVDLRGSGESSAAPRPYRVETFASDLTDLIAALDLDPVVVVGHSMGAKIGLRFAVDQPDAAEGLALLASVPIGPATFSAKLDARLRSTAGDPVALRQWLRRLFAEEPDPELLERLVAAALETAPEAAREAYESWTALDLRDDAATVATPTLVLAPRGDAPDAARVLVADTVPGSAFVEVDGGHYAQLEHPEAVAEALTAFVDDL